MIKRRCLGHWHRQWSTGTLLDTPWLLGSFGPSISPVLIQRRIPALQSFVLEMKGEDALLWYVSDSKCGSAGLECSGRYRRHGYRQISIFFSKDCSNEDKLPHQFTTCKHGQLCLLDCTVMQEVPILCDGGIELVHPVFQFLTWIYHLNKFCMRCTVWYKVNCHTKLPSWYCIQSHFALVSKLFLLSWPTVLQQRSHHIGSVAERAPTDDSSLAAFQVLFLLTSNFTLQAATSCTSK